MLAGKTIEIDFDGSPFSLKIVLKAVVIAQIITSLMVTFSAFEIDFRSAVFMQGQVQTCYFPLRPSLVLF